MECVRELWRDGPRLDWLEPALVRSPHRGLEWPYWWWKRSGRAARVVWRVVRPAWILHELPHVL